MVDFFLFWFKTFNNFKYFVCNLFRNQRKTLPAGKLTLVDIKQHNKIIVSRSRI